MSTAVLQYKPISFQSTAAAAGVLSLLDETDRDIHALALQRLLGIVDIHWAEISEHIRKIESLYEDEKFEQRQLAALICSKVYYQLNALEESVQFALGAGSLFEVNKKGDAFIDTIIAKCIDTYIKSRSAGQTDATIDPRLISVVERMFERCFTDQEYRQALGVALESRRLDVVRRAITADRSQYRALLAYALDIAYNVIKNRDFRRSVLTELVKIYRDDAAASADASTDYFGLVQCLVFLGDAYAVAELISYLIKSDNTDDVLVAYQLAFDLSDSAPQSFLNSMQALLPKASPAAEVKTEQPAAQSADGDFAMGEASSAAGASAAASSSPQDDRISSLHRILSGQVTTSIYQDFLFRQNRADMYILRNIKGSFDRNSIMHSATITANAFMHAGTSVDKFLRENLDWMKKASNWARFSVTASLGAIHRGQTKDAMQILRPYLPPEGGNAAGAGSPYSEGGSLYALGLIHSTGSGNEIIDYILRVVNREDADPVVHHGACLGIGLAAMATGREDLYDALTRVLYKDNAVSGEAAAIAAGLVMLGTANTRCVDEMLAYARETPHEKIIRGLAIGIALTMYEREESADELISQLISEKDAILRYGGMYTIGMAYCGTANNTALRKLLQIAVSDVSDDVRRAAVINIGFLLAKVPKQVPRLLQLLAESYNPHVRYGVTVAVGMSCAATGMMEAIELLEPMLKDPIDFVRQGALIGLSLVLQQFNEDSSANPQYDMIRYAQQREKREAAREAAREAREAAAASAATTVVSPGGVESPAPVTSPTSTSSPTGTASAAAAASTAVPAAKKAKASSTAASSKPALGYKVTQIRQKIEYVWSGREEILTKMGAVLSQGIIDAGGRNCVVQLVKGGHNKMRNVVGMVMFTQYWFWHPFLHFLSLSLEPTAVIGLNAQLQMPKYSFKCNVSPKFFAYPKTVSKKAEKDKLGKEFATMELSVAAKAKRRQYQKKTTEDAKMTDATQPAAEAATAAPATAPQEKKSEPEPTFEVLQNPARVTPAQMKYMSFDSDDRYEPLKFTRGHEQSTTGIIVLKYLKDAQQQPEELIEFKQVKSSDLTAGEAEDLDALMPNEISLDGIEIDFAGY